MWEGDSTHLYFMRARRYDPTTSRFVSEDPLGLSAGLNKYVFAGGDGVNGADPSGLSCYNVVSIWYDLNTGEVLWQDILAHYCDPTFNFPQQPGFGGGGGPGGGGTPSPPPPKPPSAARLARYHRNQAKQCFDKNTGWLKSDASKIIGGGAALLSAAGAIVGPVAQAEGLSQIRSGVGGLDLFFNISGTSSALVESSIAAINQGQALARAGTILSAAGLYGIVGIGGAVGSYLGASYALCYLDPGY